MSDPMYAEVLASLGKTFGYTPNEAAGEKWVVYQTDYLIVVHPERRPQVYRRGCDGVPYELEPDFL